MKILHVIPTYAPAWRHGGPVRAVDGLARAQAALGHQVSVFTTQRDGPGLLDVPIDRPVDRGGVQVRYFGLGAPRRIDRAPAMSAALAERVPLVDVVHLHSVFLWPTWAAARAARRASSPYLLSPRGILSAELIRRRGELRKRLWIALFERRNLERASGVHVTSELEAAELARFQFRLRSVCVVPNGVELPARTDRRPVGPVPQLLFLGRVTWKKGVDRLLDALVRLEGARLTIAGPDDENLCSALEARATELGVAARVDWVGTVDDSARDRLFSESDLLVLPSRSENFGNVVAEAMAAALPVVVTPQVGAAAIVREADCGVVCEGDAAALAAALTELLADPTRRRAMGAAGRSYAERFLAWPRVACAMVEAYRAAGARETAA